MSSLKTHEKVIFEKLFDRGGYVLDFNDAKFSSFFREHNVNIDDRKYLFNGTSKMKRLRAFWEIEPDFLVSRVIDALLQYAEAIENVSQDDKIKAKAVINRLQGKATKVEPSSEDEFLLKTFSKISLSSVVQDQYFLKVVKQRISEIQKTLSIAPLAAILLCGSTLEGILLDAASVIPRQFNEARSAPKKDDGQVRPLQEWTLASLIDVAHEVGILSLDIKKHSHSLRDFRNYIHPRVQAMQNFYPDHHTAKISWQVLQAALDDLAKKR
jgi:hypothetical protein